MGNIIVSELLTLDGVMEDPGGAQGFKQAGWSFHFGGADQQQLKVEEHFKVGGWMREREAQTETPTPAMRPCEE